ncbi:hypothetical protein FKM82_020766 [Ascaphus truei]
MEPRRGLGKTHDKKGGGELAVDEEGDTELQELYNSGLWASNMLALTEFLEDCVTESSLGDSGSVLVHFTADCMLEDVESEVDALDQDLEGVTLPVPRILENPPANNTLQAQNIEGDSAEDQTSPGCFCCIWRVRPKRSLFSSIRRWISKRRNRVVSF